MSSNVNEPIEGEVINNGAGTTQSAKPQTNPKIVQ